MHVAFYIILMHPLGDNRPFHSYYENNARVTYI